MARPGRPPQHRSRPRLTTRTGRTGLSLWLRQHRRHGLAAVTAAAMITAVMLGASPSTLVLARPTTSATGTIAIGLQDAALLAAQSSGTSSSGTSGPSSAASAGGSLVAGPSAEGPSGSASGGPASGSASGSTSAPVPGSGSGSGRASGSGSGGGSAAASGPYRVVGLGDSVPAGSACDCSDYVELVGQQAARQAGRTAHVDNLAEGGFTTPDVIDQLSDPSDAAAVAAADLVIVTVGANDYDPGTVADSSCDAPALSCYRSDLNQESADLARLLSRIRTLDAGRTATILVTGYWNVFLDGEVGRAQGSNYVRNSNALTLAVNRIIATGAASAGARYVDIYTPFKGDGSLDDTALLASDGDHPDAAGHRLIADTLSAALA